MCKHCDPLVYGGGMMKGRPIPCIDRGEYMEVVPETRMLVAFDKKYELPTYGLRINYCPMCGRDLRDGE